MKKIDWYEILGRQQFCISPEDGISVKNAIANHMLKEWVGGLSLSDLNQTADFLEDVSVQYITEKDFENACAAGEYTKYPAIMKNQRKCIWMPYPIRKSHVLKKRRL